MSGSSLSTKVLEAGGHIESRCLVQNLPNFTEQYVFTKESLEKFVEIITQENDHDQHHRSNP
jgi:hypothetical protein